MTTVNNNNSNLNSSGQLNERIGDVRRRLFSVGFTAAIGWALFAIVAVLLIAIWFDLLWELPAQFRTASFIVALVIGLVLFGFLAVSIFKKSNQSWLANRLDSVGDTGGEITSGLELADALAEDRETIAAPNANAQIEKGLASMAVARAAETAKTIDRSVAIPLAPVKIIAMILAGLALLIGIVGFSMPKLARTQWSRFVSPSDDVPPFTTIEFEITPGDVEIRYGEPVDIVAKLGSTPIDDLQLVLTGETEEVVPMFSEGDNQWRASLFRVTEEMKYQVRSGRARSERYDISLILVPEIVDVQFRITPPAYTRLGATNVKASEGIRALAGTRVQILAESNRPLSGGSFELVRGGEKVTVNLAPKGEQATEVIGEFEVENAGKFELKVTDIDGIESSQAIAGTVTLLKDTKPFVRLSNPKQNSLATATVNLPIGIEAEDDFGISSLSLYRSLNDSRAMPVAVEVENEASRWNVRAALPLREYDLEPGDKLELFARVEDNDPQGFKGNESPIHTVHIISRQQYEQMNQRQMGLEAVLSKYRQIQRRLEALETMQREIEAMDAGPEQAKAKPTEEQRKELTRAAKEFKNSALEMQQLLERKFPVDFDRDLESKIDEMSDNMLEISREIRELLKKIEDDKIDNDELKQRLKELREKLEGIREEFNNNVMQPLDELSKLFPLMQLQQAYSQLTLRQRNLADRLRTLDGQDDEDDPNKKRRMRELSQEQGGLLDALDELLFQIENEALQLPAKEEFNELRDSAIEFAGKVADSEAMPEQQLAKDGLAEFSGSAGFKHAKRAAEILESFIEKNDQMGEQAQQQGQKIFNPQQGKPKLGNSMRQLMDMFGPKNGQQQGRSNRGLYGDNRQANQQKKRGGGQGEDNRGAGSNFSISENSNSDPGDEINRASGSTGSSQVTVPLRYERKVGEYFRRIVEEIGDEDN